MIMFLLYKICFFITSDMGVQLKKKRRKVCIVNFVSVTCLPNAAGGLGENFGKSPPPLESFVYFPLKMP